MLKAGDRVVAGISGGADSVCLFFVLLEWAKHVPMELAVVHVNHGIRKEAAQDAEYVEELCQVHGIPFFLVEENVHQKAIAEKCSEEDAGRRVRYETFERVALEIGANKIAVAHNCNDRSETMLFHLFRGSGMKGLGSIQPVRDNIIRPILCLERKEIEDYLLSMGISYCEDATNATDEYTRNRIRHHILPYVEQEISQGCVRHMAQAAELLSETEEYLEQQTLSAMEECAIRHEEAQEIHISVSELLKFHPTIQKRVLHLLVKSLSPRQKDISYVHIRDLREIFVREGNAMVSLPFGIRGRREYDRVVLELYTEKMEETGILQTISVPLPKETETISAMSAWEEQLCLPTGDSLQISLLPVKELVGKKIQDVDADILQKDRKIPQNKYTKWFDYDKIKGCQALTIRTRQMGDYLTIADIQGKIIRKKIKDYMIDCKIPRMERDSIPLLTDGQHVLWLIGYRISEYYKVKENTKRILQVKLIPKDSE